MSLSCVRQLCGDGLTCEGQHQHQHVSGSTGANVRVGSDSINVSQEHNATAQPPCGAGGGHYITIYESELCVMAGLSATWGEHETAGSLFGLWTHGGRPTVVLVTGPGPMALHSSVHCQHDVEFFHSIRDLIENSTGMQHIGDWHGHHYLGLERPSQGDLGQIQAVTSKNHCSLWCGIITTALRNSRSDPSSPQSRQRIVRSSPPEIKINAFMYLDPQAGVYVPAAMHVLQGFSPVRMALLSSGKLDPIAIGEHGLYYPLNSICYRRARIYRAASMEPPILATLTDHIRQLPELVRTNIELRPFAGFVTIAVPLTGNRIAYIAVGDTPPHSALAVHVKSTADGKYNDVSDTILAGSRNLGVKQVYDRLTGEDTKESVSPTPAEPQPPEKTASTCVPEKKATRKPASKSTLKQLCKRIVGRVGKKTARKADVQTHAGKRARGGRTRDVGS